MDFDGGSIAVVITAAVGGFIAIGTFLRVGATERRTEAREEAKLKREMARDLIIDDMKKKVDGLGDKREATGLRVGLAEGKEVGIAEERADPQVSSGAATNAPSAVDGAPMPVSIVDASVPVHMTKNPRMQ